MRSTARRLASLAAAALLLGPVVSRADTVLDWNATLMDTVASSNAFAQARFAAIAQLAVFEAVNSITGDYQPYLGTIAAPAGASAEAAAATAAHDVLVAYFPASAAGLDASLASSLAGVPDGQAKTDGIAVGQAAAAALVAARDGDGSSPPQFYPPTSTAPGDWQTTAGCPAGGGAFFHWQFLKPFGIEAGDQFRSDPPPALDSNRYRRGYDEVKTVGAADSAARPADRSDVARYFSVASAAHAWNQAARQVSAAEGLTLSENARAFALMNMAISDGLVASMDSKYLYIRWRPITAIHEGDSDGNPGTLGDPAWTSYITAPCFPSYPSAHASASYAARRIAERMLGPAGHDFTLSHPGVPDVTLHYSSFKQLTDDIDDARVYGGIHFRFDQQAGARQGREVGAYVYRNNLRRVHHPSPDEEPCR